MTSSQNSNASPSNNSTTETIRSSTNSVAVAVAFLNWYYNNLHQDPSLVFGCYKENSVLIRASEDDPPAADIAHFGLEAIKQKLKTSNLLGCEVLFSVIDAQPSIGGGVIVLGTGTLTLQGETPRRFMQTFFLATQEEPKGYYVANDIMRFLSDSSLPELSKGRESTAQNFPDRVSQNTASSPSPSQEKLSEVSPSSSKAEENHTPTTPSTSLVVNEANLSPNNQPVDPVASQTAENSVKTPATSSQPEQTEVPSKPLSPENVEQNNNFGRRSKPDRRVKKNDGSKPNKFPRERKQRGAVPEQSKLEHVNAPQTPHDTSSQQAPAPQTSWASVLNKNQKAGGQAVSANQEQEAQISPQPATTTLTEAAVPKISPKNQHNEKQKPFAGFPKSYGKPHNKAASCSLYVGSIPFSATQKDISAVFSKFGPLKEISLNDKGFAFVEFQNAESLAKALAAAPIQVGDRTVTVEERRGKEAVHNKYYPRKNWNNGHENFHNLNFQNGTAQHVTHENNTNTPNNLPHNLPNTETKTPQDFQLNHKVNGAHPVEPHTTPINHHPVANHNNTQFSNTHIDFNSNPTLNQHIANNGSANRYFDNNRNNNNRRRGK